ncbi:MAG: tyrosine-type recombinase/integrase [Pseudonocardiaceae bacterium]
MTRERKRRQYGTGSVYQRARDGRWVGTIEAGWTRDGTRRRITVTGRTEAEARTNLKLRQRDLARGDAPTSDRTTVKAWATQWLAMTGRTARPKTHTTDRGAVTAWIIPTIGHKRLDKLTPGDARAVTDAVRAAGLSTTTGHRYHGTLRRMLKAAVAEGYTVPARVLEVRPPAVAVHDRQAIPTPQALAMLAVASTLPAGPRWFAAFAQGMRQGECLGLTWDEVRGDRLTVSWQLQALPYRDPGDHTAGFAVPDGYEARHLADALHLVRPKSKAGWRVLPLIPAMADALGRWRHVAPDSPHGLVWASPDGYPRRAREDREEWRYLQEAANVRHPSGRWYHLHEARNTTATLLLEMGVPESVRIAILGHTNIVTTRGYETVDLELARDALARVGGALRLGG